MYLEKKERQERGRGLLGSQIICVGSSSRIPRWILVTQCLACAYASLHLHKLALTQACTYTNFRYAEQASAEQASAEQASVEQARLSKLG